MNFGVLKGQGYYCWGLEADFLVGFGLVVFYGFYGQDACAVCVCKYHV